MTDQKTKTIGLCRHFPIPDVSSWQLMSTKQFQDWILFNEKAIPVKNQVFSPVENWDICFSSDLPRAKETASALAKNIQTHETSALREVPFSPFRIPLILPKGTWLLLSRLLWITGGKTPERKKESFYRAEKFLDTLMLRAEDNILVITHGFFMHVLVKKLKSLGFEGSIPLYPEYGKVYVFERQKSG